MKESSNGFKSRYTYSHKRVSPKLQRTANISLPFTGFSFRSNHRNNQIQEIQKNQRAFYEAVLKKGEKEYFREHNNYHCYCNTLYGSDISAKTRYQLYQYI